MRRKPPLPECFTVFGKGQKVLAYVDAILLEDARFIVSKAGVRRIREHGVREVIAWVLGQWNGPRS